jgi:hypothetical protein
MVRPWIEAQPILVIALIVFGISYLFAAVVFVLVTCAPKSWIHHFRQVSSVTVTAVAVVLGVLLGFLAAHVWANFDRAYDYVGQEAGALAQTLMFAETFPPDIRTRLRDTVAAHVKSVVDEEWPAMARREGIARGPSASLAEAVTTILAFTPASPKEELARKRALVAVEKALDARHARIMLSGVTIDRTQWRVIMLLFALIMATVGMVHADNRTSNAIALFLVASASATSFVLLLAYDHPLSARGGAFVEPTVLRELFAR